MIQGALQFLAGLLRLLRTEALRRILWRMIGLLLCLVFVLCIGTFFLFDQVLSQWVPADDAGYWFLLSWLIGVISVLASVFIGITGFTILASAAVAPWLDTLAVCNQRLHGIACPENHEPWWQQSITALIHSIRPVSILLAWGALAFLLFFIPLLGPIVSGIIWLYAGIIFLCFELMDTTATQRQMSYAQRKHNIQEQRMFWLGFGGMSMLWMSIPILNILVIPAAVVALSSPAKQPYPTTAQPSQRRQ